MKGLIIYPDCGGNENYIKWHIEKFASKGIDLELCLLKDLDYRNLPDFAIMRAIAPDISKKLEEYGVRVFNSSFVSETANNKSAAYSLMRENNIPFMPIYSDISDIQFPVVVKSNSGHGGTEVFWADNLNELEHYRRLLKNDCVIQAPCSDLGRDVRVYVMGSHIISAMLRISDNDFRSNFCLGGRAEVYTLSPEEKSLVYKIAGLINADYIGIDFIFNNGKIIFNEIEDVVGSRMLYTYTDIDIVQLYTDYICKQMNS